MLSAALIVTLVLAANPAPPTVRLWDGKAPESVGDGSKDNPTLTVFLPPEGKANGTAVVVCPGGGYGFLASTYEGDDVARWLNARGAAGFVLRYRIATKDRPGPLQPAPMLDVQRAIRYVRAHTKDYGVDPKRIGVWGFSAGGHLASTAATHFDDGKPDATDPVDRLSCRPDFAVLAYPVISMGKATHGGSRHNLLGDKSDPKLVEFYSSDKQVTDRTPPTFIFHTAEDKAVPVENARLFKEACDKHGVKCELLVEQVGQHGIGLGGNRAKGLPAANWPEKLEAWMAKQGLLGNQ